MQLADLAKLVDQLVGNAELLGRLEHSTMGGLFHSVVRAAGGSFTALQGVLEHAASIAGGTTGIVSRSRSVLA
jgi:hypothetical protein